MSHVGYHTFTNETSGSLIHVDLELHENIDYDFFEDTKDISIPENHGVTEEEHKDKKSNLKVNKTYSDDNAGDLEIVEPKETPKNDISGSTVRFSLMTENVRKENIGEECLSERQENTEEEHVSSKEEKQRKLKDLMNCIAYENEGKMNANCKISSPSPDFLSLSTDTTSEITTVTTRPSSSGCSSMGKFESEECLLDRKQKVNNGTSSMKLLLDALESFDKQEMKSTSSSISSSASCKSRKNMSFTNEQLRKIERDNGILAKKLENLKKSRPKPPHLTVCPRLSSSAINRKRQQKKIEHDNMILLKKIEMAKPSATIRQSSLRR